MNAMAPSGVVLLHGLARTPRSLRRMERALQRDGFATLNLGYESRKHPLEHLAKGVDAAIAPFAAKVGALHFVTHSMGGLLARLYLAQHRPARLQRVVMLGTPNGGSEVADFLKELAPYRAFYGPAGQQVGARRRELFSALPAPDYAAGIVAGIRTIDPIASFFIVPRPNDGRVSVESTRLEGMADHVVVAATHSGLLRHPHAIDQTIAFLRDGKFLKSRDDPQQTFSAVPLAGRSEDKA